MAAARRPAPIFVLRGQVNVYDAFADESGHGWTKIECASKRAYGYGEHAKEALEGLTLYARLGNDPLVTSSLAIGLTDNARRSFESELDLICPRMDMPICSRTIATGVVQMADEQGLTVIFLQFRRNFHPGLAYYLVYDHATASLCLIQHLPDVVEDVCSLKPVAKRNDSNDFELFVMGLANSQLSLVPHYFLCACTPETRANTASDGTGPWQIKEQSFRLEEIQESFRPWQIKEQPFQIEEIQEPFGANLVFSFRSKGIWADLSRGFMYCDLNNSDDVDFGFIELPQEYLLDTMQEEMAEMSIKVARTMGCVEDSIWFVCIDPATEYANDLVKMWTLKLPHGNGRMKDAQWKKVREARLSELWRLDSFREAGLPEGLLHYPVLTADGALCLMLSDQSKFPGPYQGVQQDHICIFDMKLKRLQWHGFVHDYHFTNPVIFPSNFLRRKLHNVKFGKPICQER